MENITFPSKIKELISGKTGNTDNIGKSKSTVILYDDMVLKIEEYSKKVEATIRMMNWLEGKIPAPKVICHEVWEGKSYLLMSRIKGEMSCHEYYLEHPQELLALLAKALKMLWSVDISDCPCKRPLDELLKEREYLVENDLVDIEDTQPETFGEGGFENPRQLLEWLRANKPEQELVLSHGDFCLPNIFIDNDDISGFIDLGDMGVGDKWNDIAICYRSLKHNFDGTYGGKVYEDFNADMLFEALGIKPDWEKIRYYILLDELC